MKRFKEWIKEISIGGLVFLAVVLLSSIVGGIWIFLSLDKVPATESDYMLLEKQMYDFQKNPELLLKTSSDVSINDDVITVLFKSDECKIKVQYDEEYNILSTSRIDNSIPLWGALLQSIYVSAFIFIIGGVALLTLVSVLVFIYDCVTVKK